MRLTATILSGLLAASTAVSAQPWNGRPVPGDRDQRGYDRRTDEGARRGDEGYRPYERYGERGRWRLLLDRYTTTTDRQYIPLGGNFHFARLRIEGTEGRPFVHVIKIMYMNHTDQYVRVERPLAAGQGIIVDLQYPMEPLRRIEISTNPDYGSSYTVMAE